MHSPTHSDTVSLPPNSPRCAPPASMVFTKFAILLNEDNSNRAETSADGVTNSARPNTPTETDSNFGYDFHGDGTHRKSFSEEPLITQMGKLLQAKIKAHTIGLEVEIFTAKTVMERNSPTLVPVMYRIAAEGFVKTCRNVFKIIECRNCTKLVSDWKPTLPDTLNKLNHQVIIVQLKECFSPYNDFVYAVLRQLDYDWKIRLPRSFFYPDDVCKVEETKDRQLILITPSMPDGELKISDKVSHLTHEIMMMLKSSCISAIENHLVMRDLRVGKFCNTLSGVSALRHVYRSLQQHLEAGEETSFATNSESFMQYLSSAAGDTILSAEALIEACKKLGMEEEEVEVIDTPTEHIANAATTTTPNSRSGDHDEPNSK